MENMKTYTTPEVAKILQCSEGTARDLIQRLPHCRVGYAGSTQGKIRISEDILKKYIDGEIEPKTTEYKNTVVKTNKTHNKVVLIPRKRIC